MKDLKSRDYEKFGEAFLTFYTENGFGNKSKSDIDAEIYDIICKLGFIDDTQSALIIGRDLRATESSVKKYKEDRFVKHKIEDVELKKQAIDIFKDNQYKISKGRIIFTVGNIAAKLYIETILQQSKQNYDYTNNPSNISMDVRTFLFVFQLLGGDISEITNAILEDKEIQQSSNYQQIQQNIHNIVNNHYHYTLFGDFTKLLEPYFSKIASSVTQYLLNKERN